MISLINSSSTSPAAADFQKEPFGLPNSNNNTNNSFDVLGADVGYESAASEFKEEPPDDEEHTAATAPAVHDPNRPVLEEHRHMGLAPCPPRELFNVDTFGVDDLLHDDKAAPGLSCGDLNDEDASYPSVAVL